MDIPWCDPSNFWSRSNVRSSAQWRIGRNITSPDLQLQYPWHKQNVLLFLVLYLSDIHGTLCQLWRPLQIGNKSRKWMNTVLLVVTVSFGHKHNVLFVLAAFSTSKFSFVRICSRYYSYNLMSSCAFIMFWFQKKIKIRAGYAAKKKT